MTSQREMSVFKTERIEDSIAKNVHTPKVRKMFRVRRVKNRVGQVPGNITIYF